MKHCEVCQKEIPNDYGNALCDEHYVELTKAQSPSDSTATETTKFPPEYKTNPQMPDKEQIATNLELFMKNGVLLWKPTRLMYEFIRDWCLDQVQKHPQFPKLVWRPSICDVGCGSGVGTNILSCEADLAWGIDKNLKSIQFAQQAFSRVKNGIYYSAQVTFDHIDIMEDTREFQKCDVVVAIEIIEHIEDWQGFIDNLIEKLGKPGTVYWISTPNRNNKSLSQDGPPKNKYHVREWTSKELIDSLKKTFNTVELFNAAGEPIPKEEYETTTHTPLLSKCKI